MLKGTFIGPAPEKCWMIQFEIYIKKKKNHFKLETEKKH